MSASDGERSPKRQRLESYSPASPPLHETKGFVGLPPNTPPPSVRMSPSWQSQSQSHQQQHSSSTSHSTIPTPPSTAGFHGPMNHKGGHGEGEGGGSGQATPATDAGHDVRTRDSEMMEGKSAEDTEMGDSEHRRTDHERQGDGPAAPVIALYKLDNAMKPVPPSRPHPGENIMEMYSLQRIQASVARRDPVTGEKINKLRKSYENKVKSLNLEGRNKATANQGELGGLVDPGWSVMVGNGLTLFQERHQGRELGNAAAEKDLLSKLDLALSLEPGRLPGKEHDHWKNLLGLDDAGPLGASTGTPKPSASFGAASAVSKTAPAMQRNMAPASPRSVARPERSGKKRRYDESSYAGYDGYEDDGQPLKQRVRV